jgi:hypothetical protein
MLNASGRDVRPALIAVLTAVLFFALLWTVHGFFPTGYDNYVILADAWLHGHLWVQIPGPYIDAMPLNGHYWIVEAPFPAVLMIPSVLLGGLQANQTLICSLVGALGVGAFVMLARRLDVTGWQQAALVLLAVFGTSYAACATRGDVWFYAHVCAVAFSALALGEACGRRRGWVLALWAWAAALSRYPLLPLLAVYGLWLLWRAPRREAVRYVLASLPMLIVWVCYNEARWHTPYDPAFTIWYHIMDPASHGNGPPFELANIPMQLRALFIAPPRTIAQFPWFVPRTFGFGLLWTGFAFLAAPLALRGIFRDPRVTLFTLAAIVTILPALLYYDTGGAQFGARHFLDAMPFVWALLALATRGRIGTPIAVLAAIGAAFGMYEATIWMFAPSLVT